MADIDNTQDSKPRPAGRGQGVEMQSVDRTTDKKLAFSSDNAPAGESDRGGRGGRAGQAGRGKKGPRAPRERDVNACAVEQVIKISRVAKVTKGGTKMSFTALVVVGDGKGHVGYALGKAAEVAVAIKKGMGTAKKNMIEVPIINMTIPHQILGGWCATRVLLKPAGEGTGVIAAGPIRAICDGAGIKNILTKVHRSSNPMNVVRATFEGISRLKKRVPVVEPETK